MIGERNVMWVLGTGQCGHKEKMEKIRRRNKEKDGELKFMFVFKTMRKKFCIFFAMSV